VKSGNPASRTPAFAIAAADSLLQRGALGDPTVAAKRYLELIRTGDLETITSSGEASSMLIRREHEAFRKGENPPVLAVHKHRQHIEEHSGFLSSPETLEDPKIGPAGLSAHPGAHPGAEGTDPALLMLIGETPLPPVPGMLPMPMGTPPTPGKRQGPAGRADGSSTRAAAVAAAERAPAAPPAAADEPFDPRSGQPPRRRDQVLSAFLIRETA
jgi:hypothetical protein